VLVGAAWSDRLVLGTLAGARPSISWALPAAGLAVVVGITGLLRQRRTPAAGVATVVTVGGIWATVPDTELAAVALGATSVLIWSWFPPARVRPGVIGSAVVVTMLGGIVLAGAPGREAALVAGLGVLAAWGLVVGAGLPRVHPPTSAFALALVVLGWTQLAGSAGSGATAILAGLAWSAVVLVVGRVLARNLARRAPLR